MTLKVLGNTCSLHVVCKQIFRCLRTLFDGNKSSFSSPFVKFQLRDVELDLMEGSTREHASLLKLLKIALPRFPDFGLTSDCSLDLAAIEIKHSKRARTLKPHLIEEINVRA